MRTRKGTIIHLELWSGGYPSHQARVFSRRGGQMDPTRIPFPFLTYASPSYPLPPSSVPYILVPPTFFFTLLGLLSTLVQGRLIPCVPSFILSSSLRFHSLLFPYPHWEIIVMFNTNSLVCIWAFTSHKLLFYICLLIDLSGIILYIS